MNLSNGNFRGFLHVPQVRKKTINKGSGGIWPSDPVQLPTLQKEFLFKNHNWILTHETLGHLPSTVILSRILLITTQPAQNNR